MKPNESTFKTSATLIRQTLSQIPQLAHLSPPDLQELENAAIRKTVPSKSLILERRGLSSSLLIIESGHAEVLDQSLKRQYSLCRGDWFLARPTHFSLHSDSRVKLCLIPYHTINKVLARNKGCLFAFPAQQLVSIAISVLLFLLVTTALWQTTLFERPAAARWVFDMALLPYSVGEFNLAQGHPSNAASYFRESLVWNPEYSPAYHALAKIEYERGEKELAVAYWQQALQYDANLGEAYANLAIALAEQGSIAEAIELMKKAIPLDPNEPALYHVLGDMYLKQNHMLEARRAFLEASRLDATNPEAFHKLAHLYLIEKDYDQAQFFFEETLTLNSTFYLAEQGLGVLYFEQHQLAKALEHFKNAIVLSPHDPISYFYVGLIYEQQGQAIPSKDAFSQVIRLNAPAKMAERAAGYVQRLSQQEQEVSITQ